MVIVSIEHAGDGDLPAIERIARVFPQELGWVRRVALQDALARGTLLVARWSGAVAGYCEYRARRDGWRTIYSVAVQAQGQGIGRALVNAVGAPVRLKCPVDSGANAFYRAIGFSLISVDPGRERALNVWIYTGTTSEQGRLF